MNNLKSSSPGVKSRKWLKDKIAIVGVGATPFGEHFHWDYTDLAREAVTMALKDAGLEANRIEGAWLGTAFPDAGVYRGRSGMDLAESVALFDIPITRVSNYCATGAEAIRGAINSLLSGETRVALAVGVEKLRDRSPQESIVKMMVEAGHPYYQKGFTAAGTFAIYAQRYMKEFGLRREELSEISVKNHFHGSLNPNAHHKKAVTVDKVLKSPMVADPLTLMDSCPTTDGACALIMVRAEEVGGFKGKPVYFKGMGLSVSTGWDLPFFDDRYDFLSFRATRIAAAKAYEEADIRNPLEELDLAEVHDCFSIVELLTYEDLGLCSPGKGKELLLRGETRLGGKLPVNVSGGLLSCGHPVGATGVRMVCEIAEHLRGRAGKRQVSGARLGLAHNIGGPGAIASVTILGGEKG